MEQVILGNYCTITSSKRIFAHQYVADGIPFYRSKEIIEKYNNQPVSERLYISIADFNYISKKFGVPKSGDILLTSVGTIGIPYLVKEETFYFKDGNLTWLKDFSDGISSHYVYYWLSSSFGKNSLLQLAIGSSQPAITIEILKKYKLNLPNISIQCRIASILSAYDNLIENNNKRIRLLEQMAENLYKEWFVRFRFPGHENTEFENGLPKGWKIWTIKELCDINRRSISSKTSDTVIDYLDTSSITCNQINRTERYTIGAAPSRARRKVKQNSIIVSTVRPNLKHYGILKQMTDNLIVSTGFVVFDAKYDVANIVYLFLSSQEVVDYCQLIAEGSVATYPSIKPEEISRLKIVLPPLKVAEEWNQRIESIFSNLINLQRQTNLLSRQRDLLLPRLMSGKLEVNV